MRSTILDLAASTQSAREMSESFYKQALERLSRDSMVSASLIREVEGQAPRSLLWPKIMMDQTWSAAHVRNLDDQRLRHFLTAERDALQSFSCDATRSLMQMLDWTLPEGHDPTDLAPGSSQEKIKAALALIEKFWPEGGVNLRAICVGVLWFASPTFYNFSYIANYGGIFFRPDVLDKSPLEIATLMIHEAAHHVLFIEFLRDPLLVDDPAKTVYSPLRRTERPIHGVFQSQAALARMIIWLHQVLEAEDQLPADVIEEARDLCQRYESDLKLVTGPMSKMRYSPYGERIMQDFVFICEHI